MLRELKKLYSSKYIIIALLIIFGVAIWFAVNAYKAHKNDTYDDYSAFVGQIKEQYDSSEKLCTALKEMYAEYEEKAFSGSTDATKIPGTLSKTLMGDYLVVSKASTNANYVYNQFPSDRKKLIKNALSLIEQEKSKQNPDQKIIKSNEKVIELYNRVIDLELEPTGDIAAAYSYFDYSFWDYLMIIFVVLLSVRMFTLDIKNGSYQIIFSSIGGRKKLCLKQIGAVVFSVAATVILYSLIQIFCAYFFFGVQNWSSPIQIYSDYEFCPYAITVAEFFLIKTLAKIIFFVFVAALTILLTVIFRKIIPAFALSSLITLGLQLLLFYYYTYSTDYNSNQLQSKYEIYNLLRSILPHGLLNVNLYYKSYDCVSILGMQVSRLAVNMTVGTALIIVCLLPCVMMYGNPRKG